MSDFYDLIDEYLGDADALSDIRITVRRLWFYDFDGYPTRVWQGKNKLFTSDGQEWLGTIDAGGTDHHVTPSIQDGRDGSSVTYNFSITLPSNMDEPLGDVYDSLKSDQGRVFNRKLTCYLVVFNEGEGLRPATPFVFFKQLIMQSPTFSETLVQGNDGSMVRSYKVTIIAKDANFGRSNTPNRTYNDTTQREYARQLGVTTVDKGCEFVASLANRTYQIP